MKSKCTRTKMTEKKTATAEKDRQNKQDTKRQLLVRQQKQKKTLQVGRDFCANVKKITHEKRTWCKIKKKKLNLCPWKPQCVYVRAFFLFWREREKKKGVCERTRRCSNKNFAWLIHSWPDDSSCSQRWR